MGIKLSPQEKEELKVFLDTAMFSTTLINDFHSWPKEIKHHIETPGSERPFNAVAILMRHSGCSEEEALQKLREKQVEIQEQHLALLRKLQSEKEIPGDHMLYILAAQYAASGSEFWSIHVPRYPSKEDLNQPEVEFVDGAFRYKTDIDRTWVVVEPNATVCKLKESAMPNGNCTTNEHASSNELASANGHTATSGRSAPTGQAGSHLPVNGHCSMNGHSLKKRKSDLRGSRNLSNGHIEMSGAPKKRIKGNHAVQESNIQCSNHVSSHFALRDSSPSYANPRSFSPHTNT